MLQRQNKNVYQGASFIENIVLTDESGNIQHLSQGDKIIFGIRPYYSDECIIKRVLTLSDEVDNAYPVNITPEELEIEPDEYKYDVSIKTASGDFIKIVPESSFNVLKLTTHKREVGS